MASPWTNDWRGFLGNRLSQLGFGSLTEFVQARESATFRELANELGREHVAPIQIQRLLVEEADSEKQFQYVVRTTLVREIRRIAPKGWRQNGEATFQFHHALASWSTSFPETYSSQCAAVIDKLLTIDRPDGWVPANVDDPVIAKAFSDLWFPFL